MTVFYRKYRPQSISEIVGQEIVKNTLLAQLKSGKVAHGYLFAGPRGTGKTSMARIFAKAVNCERYASNDYGEPCNKCLSCTTITNGSNLDLVEIDAASNRGIDEIRDLREKIKLSPVSARFKVYIIDEAHMLTTEAFNALLKTLEEPPAHAIFILCTTAVGKLPATIISRLMRFEFLRASEGELVSAIERIAEREKIAVDREVFGQIAKVADGSFRDAASILDQLASGGRKITKSSALSLLKISGWGQQVAFVENIFGRQLKEAVVFVEEFADSGGEIGVLVRETMKLLEEILLLKIEAGEVGFPDFDSRQKGDIEKLSQKINMTDLQNLMKLFLVAEGEINLYPQAKIVIILALCKFCGETNVTELVGREEKAKEGETHKNSESNSLLSLTGQAESDSSLRPRETKASSKKPRGSRLGEIEKGWSAFLSKVRPVNIHLSALLRSTRPSDFDGVNLVLEVFYRFHKERLEEPKIVKTLEGILADVYGKKINLKTTLAKKESKLPKVVAESNLVDVPIEDLSSIAQEIFTK